MVAKWVANGGSGQLTWLRQFSSPELYLACMATPLLSDIPPQIQACRWNLSSVLFRPSLLYSPFCRTAFGSCVCVFVSNRSLNFICHSHGFSGYSALLKFLEFSTFFQRFWFRRAIFTFIQMCSLSILGLGQEIQVRPRPLRLRRCSWRLGRYGCQLDLQRVWFLRLLWVSHKICFVPWRRWEIGHLQSFWNQQLACRYCVRY